MSMLKTFQIAGSAVQAQSQRLNIVASNLANAESVAGPDGQAYRSRQVMFEAVPVSAQPGFHMPALAPAAMAVRVKEVVTDRATPMRQVYDPKHPMADAKGYVQMSNVNPIDEVVNMISASRSYQSNVDVMATARTLMQKTLQLGNS